MTTQPATNPTTNGTTAAALLDDQVATFKRDGFVVIEDVLQGDELEQAIAAFNTAQYPARLDWEKGRAQGKGISENGEYYASGTWHARKYFDVYPLHFLEQNDAAVQTIAHPRLLPFLSASVGEDVQAATIQLRVLEPQMAADAQAEGGYVAWHRDHRITGQVTLDAVFPFARDHLHFEELWRDEGLEPHNTGTILFWGTEQADTVIDIAEHMDAKLQAVGAHKSQMDGRNEKEVEDFVRERAMEDVGGSGSEFAEAFRKLTFRT